MKGKVIEKQEKAKSNGELYYKYKIEVDNKEVTITDWKNFNLNLNHTYDLEWEEKQREYEGKPVVYRNLTMAIESKDTIGKPIYEMKPANEFKKEEPTKDVLIIRQSVLKVAAELVATQYRHESSKNDLTQECIDCATILEKWVLRERS